MREYFESVVAAMTNGPRDLPASHGIQVAQRITEQRQQSSQRKGWES